MNFFDVKIKRDKREVLATVFRKLQSNLEIINRKCKTLYQYKIVALRTYINRAIIVCSNEKILKEEINLVKKVGRRTRYHPKTIDKIYEKRIKQLEEIEPAQRGKKNYTIAITYDRGSAFKLKKEATKFNICIPVER